MFERFTATAREVVVEAKAGSARLGHGHVGCEHLLLALSESVAPAGAVLRSTGITPEGVLRTIQELLDEGRAGDRADRDALAGLGIDLDQVRRAAEASFGPGALDLPPRRRWWRRRRRRDRCAQARKAGQGRWTPRAKRALECSLREALRLGHRHIGPEHIALALTAFDDTLAAAIVVRLGVRPGQLRAALLESVRRTA